MSGKYVQNYFGFPVNNSFEHGVDEEHSTSLRSNKLPLENLSDGSKTTAEFTKEKETLRLQLKIELSNVDI